MKLFSFSVQVLTAATLLLGVTSAKAQWNLPDQSDAPSEQPDSNDDGEPKHGGGGYNPGPYLPPPVNNYPPHNPGPGWPNPYPSPGYPSYGTEDIKCESRDMRPGYCRGNYVRDIRRVDLIRQLSKSSCWGNYGERNGYLVVTNGCRGWFRIQGRR